MGQPEVESQGFWSEVIFSWLHHSFSCIPTFPVSFLISCFSCGGTSYLPPTEAETHNLLTHIYVFWIRKKNHFAKRSDQQMPCLEVGLASSWRSSCSLGWGLSFLFWKTRVCSPLLNSEEGHVPLYLSQMWDHPESSFKPLPL